MKLRAKNNTIKDSHAQHNEENSNQSKITNRKKYINMKVIIIILKRN